jgi:probable HAF family extracellular repeat protein
MNSFRQLRNVWIPWVTTIVLACFSNAVAQTTYKITDLGTNKSSDNFSMAMGLNNQGWTENMDGFVNPPENNLGTTVARGRAVVNRDGVNIDLGTLGNPDTGNSWINWGGINDRGEAVGQSETSVPDPNGEDVCAFGTHLTCVPFVWQNGHMSALPTVGGNNGQASAINNRGEVVGFAETNESDPGCPTSKIRLPVLWEGGKAQALPTVGSDPDGFAFGINDQGQAVGQSNNCTGSIIRAVRWENNTVFTLPDLGGGSIAQAINNQGQIVGIIGSADGTTEFGALWQNGVLTNLGTLTGQFASIATGINSKGQVVGSTFDSGFNWSGGFIWQNHVITDLNTLIPADSNLFIINASNINERGQISGMAFVHAGPHAGDIHSVLMTPVDGSIGTSMADFARTHPHANLPANTGNHLQRFGLVRFDK